MRITDRLIFDSARSSAAQARESAQAAQDLVTNGTRIRHPGDDPAGAGMIIAFQMSSERFGAIASAASTASDELNAADGALGGVATSLSRARELAVQFSSANYTGSQRAAAAVEVGTLVDSVVASLNTRFGNRYLFGGTADRSEPFHTDGTFTGNGVVREVEVAPGIWQGASVRADVMMGFAGGGTNVLATLQALQAALAGNDPTAVGASLVGLDASIGQVASARAEAGASMNALDAASAAAKIAATDDQTQATKQGEVDLTDAAVQMQATQTALEASLSAAAQSFKISLLDFLR